MIVNYTDTLVNDLDRLRHVGFPPSVVHQAKRCLLDYLGATLAGSRMLQERGDQLLDYLGGSHGEATVIGFSRKAGVQEAVFLNGLSAHVAELDDGVRFGMIHPGSPILSALLPIAQKENVPGTDLLTGVIIGYEAAVRLACAIQPSHYNSGYHPTSTCGAIGAAVGTCAMLGLSKSQMKDALSAAATSAAGTLKVLEDGSELKPFNAARAAVVGLLAASMARVGFVGPDDPLAGDTGFFSMTAKGCDFSQLEGAVGRSLAVERVYVKPYAACRHAHPAIEAAMRIRMNSGVRASDVERIKITTYRGVLGIHDYTEVHGSASARMSIPYSVAVALATGRAGIEEFDHPFVNDAEIISLAKKVLVCADDQLTALVPQRRAAIVEVATTSGAYHTERVDFPKGEPENPLSDGELEEKFSSLAAYAKRTRQESDQIARTVWNVEENLRTLYPLL